MTSCFFRANTPLLLDVACASFATCSCGCLVGVSRGLSFPRLCHVVCLDVQVSAAESPRCHPFGDHVVKRASADDVIAPASVKDVAKSLQNLLREGGRTVPCPVYTHTHDIHNTCVHDVTWETSFSEYCDRFLLSENQTATRQTQTQTKTAAAHVASRSQLGHSHVDTSHYLKDWHFVLQATADHIPHHVPYHVPHHVPYHVPWFLLYDWLNAYCDYRRLNDCDDFKFVYVGSNVCCWCTTCS